MVFHGGIAISRLVEKTLHDPVKGLENYVEMLRLLTKTKGAIKVYCEVAAIEAAQTAAAAP